MIKTEFKPSIHGWPFSNSFTYNVPYLDWNIDMGFCGGMCWAALERFYGGGIIPRNAPLPANNQDPLYQQIWDEQIDSLTGNTLWKIWEWQSSPDCSDSSNLHHSLGSKTKEDWDNNVRPRLNENKPVTLTVITRSNNPWVPDIKYNHRVIAYAYDERALSPGEDAPSGADAVVKIWIYDPNYPDNDKVYLTFFKGGEKSEIRLRHYCGDEVHGFFLDDSNRNYTNNVSTTVSINKCNQTGISSATEADYKLEFSWQCRIIPYFCILVDGIKWKYNDSRPNGAKYTYAPSDKNEKQCQTRSGNMSVQIKLPRALSTVTVRLQDFDGYDATREIDARPGIVCYPYVHLRDSGDGLQVSDNSIPDTDLYIKDTQPTPAAVQQLDTSPFRWVFIVPPKPSRDFRGNRDDRTLARVFVSTETRLGNITAPILGKIVEKNLALPTITLGVVTISKNGQPDQIINIPSLSTPQVKIFGGFQDNPFDYDNDTTVKFTYSSTDRFGVSVRGEAYFYGQSIIHQRSLIEIYSFDPTKIAAMEGKARELIERGIIDTTIKLPVDARIPGGRLPPGGSQPRPVDPGVRFKKLRSHRLIQREIDQTLTGLWNDKAMWQEVWKEQSEMLKLEDTGKTIQPTMLKKAGAIMAATNEVNEANQKKYDAIAINRFAFEAINKLCKAKAILEALKTL